MAKKLKAAQDTVSRAEKSTDMLLSTHSGYVNAMGAQLNPVAEFPDRPPPRLKMLELLKKRTAPAGRKAAKAKRA